MYRKVERIVWKSSVHLTQRLKFISCINDVICSKRIRHCTWLSYPSTLLQSGFPWLSWPQCVWKLEVSHFIECHWLWICLAFPHDWMQVLDLGRNVAEIVLCVHCILSVGVMLSVCVFDDLLQLVTKMVFCQTSPATVIFFLCNHLVFCREILWDSVSILYLILLSLTSFNICWYI